MWGLERSALCSWGSNGAVIQSAECAVVAVVAVAVAVTVAVAVAVQSAHPPKIKDLTPAPF